MIFGSRKNLPKDINLEKMIPMEYRSSLLLYNYESKLALELLDTTVTGRKKRSITTTILMNCTAGGDSKIPIGKISGRCKITGWFYKIGKTRLPWLPFVKVSPVHRSRRFHMENHLQLETCCPKNL